jgi:VanZ family protein
LKDFIKKNTAGIVWGILIFFLTALPSRLIPDTPTFLSLFEPDKLIHVFIYCVFVFLWMKGLLFQEKYLLLRKYPVIVSMNLGILLGGITELLQQWIIPGRIASPYDFIANVLGCFIGWWLFMAWMKRKKRMRNQG